MPGGRRGRRCANRRGIGASERGGGERRARPLVPRRRPVDPEEEVEPLSFPTLIGVEEDRHVPVAVELRPLQEEPVEDQHRSGRNPDDLVDGCIRRLIEGCRAHLVRTVSEGEEQLVNDDVELMGVQVVALARRRAAKKTFPPGSVERVSGRPHHDRRGRSHMGIRAHQNDGSPAGPRPAGTAGSVPHPNEALLVDRRHVGVPATPASWRRPNVPFTP